MYVFIDQYNAIEYARNITTLRKRLKGRCSKMYIDNTDGSTVHVGYVISDRWFRMYKSVETKVS